jgi:hypothetical protein
MLVENKLNIVGSISFGSAEELFHDVSLPDSFIELPEYMKNVVVSRHLFFTIQSVGRIWAGDCHWTIFGQRSRALQRNAQCRECDAFLRSAARTSQYKS